MSVLLCSVLAKKSIHFFYLISFHYSRTSLFFHIIFDAE